MRSGDTVLHRPSGETWTVSYVEGQWLAWYGWPPGEARVSDCELVEACTDAEHEDSLKTWAWNSGQPEGGDRRKSVCSHQLAQLNQAFVGQGI